MSPFALPRKIEEELCPVHKHWRLLKRAGNEMPFWDDLKLNELSSFADRLMIIDVIERPERFRFNTVGNALAAHYGINPVGKFTNEIEPKPPFNYLTAQCSSTAESRAPTYYERKANKDLGSKPMRACCCLFGARAAFGCCLALLPSQSVLRRSAGASDFLTTATRALGAARTGLRLPILRPRSGPVPSHPPCSAQVWTASLTRIKPRACRSQYRALIAKG